MRLCASWAAEYGPSTFVILINFSNLAVGKQKLRPSERQEHRIPNLRKALAVVRKLGTVISFEQIMGTL